PAGSIALPTTGAIVTATSSVVANATGTIGPYCLVSGNILPVDPTAPNIMFQLALPTTWNKKLMMFGGGGFDGSIPAVTGNTPQGTTTGLVPLGRGYAVFASDSGHQDTSDGGGKFSTNQEAYLNFMGDALKKTRDASYYLVQAFYLTNPVKSYFAGGSTGGRESLTVIQRWPADWDGAIAHYPAYDFSALTLGQLSYAQDFAAPGAWLDTPKRTLLYNAALSACDALDGAVDGVISNVQGCLSVFNPATATLSGTALRCPGGVDTGDTCLSDAQITALNTANSPVPFNFPLGSGETNYPGYNVTIADLGVPNSSPYAAYVSLLALGSIAPASPVTSSMMFDLQISDSWTRYTVANNQIYNSLTLNITNPGAFASRLDYLSSLDATNANLTPFMLKGGKLLMMHGTTDQTVSPRATEAYLARMQAIMGVNAVNSFARYYEVPGFQHAFSDVFMPSWDNLTELENWVESAIVPPAQVITDSAGVPGRTRPLCTYPTYAKYSGTGSINLASSFTCSR
ncbi:MAG: tannase/feruloyl esterase family alpha/beta hydrolase, partial [Janthinobacterium lividum]